MGLPSRVSRVITVVLVCFAFLVVVVPWQGELDRLGELSGAPPASGAPDFTKALVTLVQAGAWWRVEPAYSTFLVLHQQFARGGAPASVGPYGPWGLLYRGYAPGNYATLVMAWSFLAIAFAAGIVALLRSVPEWWLRAVVAISLLFVVAVNPRVSVPLMIPVLMVLSPKSRSGGRGRLPAGGATPLVLACACGLASLIFAPALVIAAVVMLVMAIDSLMRRSVPWAVLIFALSYGGFGLLSRQSFSALSRYKVDSLLFRWSPAAAQIDPLSALVAVVAAALIVLDAWFAARKGTVSTEDNSEDAVLSARTHRALPAIVMLIALLCLLKSGAVVGGGMRAVVFSTVGVTIVLLALPLSTRMTAGARAAFVLVVCAAAAVLAVPMSGGAGEIWRQIAAAANPPAARRRSDAQFVADRLAIVRRHSLALVKGTVDIYPQRASLLLANEMKYDPRPFFQSGFADTPARAEANAGHLRGAGAPQWIVFETAQGEARLASLDDSLSWPDILTRYDLRAAIPGAVLFERNRSPRAWRTVPLEQVTPQLGQGMAVPSMTAPIWARITVHPSLAGRVASMIFSAPPISIILHTADGERAFRLDRGLARAGFLLSPLITEPILFAHLHVGRWSELQRSIVTGMRIEAPRWAYAARVDIELSRVDVAPSPWVR